MDASRHRLDLATRRNAAPQLIRMPSRHAADNKEILWNETAEDVAA
jgi:hypothetical protein